MSNLIIQTAAFIVLCLPRLSFGSGYYKIKFVEYSNPHAVDDQNYACDSEPKCDFYFKVDHSCGEGWNYDVSNVKDFKEVIRFDTSFSPRTSNPIVRRFREWGGFLQYRIVVYDLDPGSRSTRCDTFDETLRFPADGRWRRVNRTSSHHKGYLSLSVVAACRRYYYGKYCSKFCAPRDNRKGHYTCDRNGDKVCRRGWRNVRRRCLERDVCAVVSCPHGTVCRERKGGHHCVCPPTGGASCVSPGCEIAANVSASPCLHGGTCVDPGPTQLDECVRNGSCVDSVDVFSCRCRAGFSGELCEMLPVRPAGAGRMGVLVVLPLAVCAAIAVTILAIIVRHVRRKRSAQRRASAGDGTKSVCSSALTPAPSAPLC